MGPYLRGQPSPGKHLKLSVMLTHQHRANEPRSYSSFPSKQKPPFITLLIEKDGCVIPLIPWALGRTQPKPSVSRSIGAELTGELISIFGICCSNLLALQCHPGQIFDDTPQTSIHLRSNETFHARPASNWPPTKIGQGPVTRFKHANHWWGRALLVTSLKADTGMAVPRWV